MRALPSVVAPLSARSDDCRRTSRFGPHNRNAQQIDHVAVVPSLLPNSQAEILHLSTWTANRSPLQASDHDPVLVRINVC